MNRLALLKKALLQEFGYGSATIEKLFRNYFPEQSSERCWNCGHEPGAIARHTLSPMLVEALAKFRMAVHHYGSRKLRDGLPPYAIHLRGDMGKDSPFPLLFDQVTNFSKLKTHGFVAHADKENSRSGYWLLTPRGVAFLKGEIQVAKVALSQEGHKIGEEGLLVTVKDFAGVEPWLVRDTSEAPARVEPAKTASMRL